MLRILGAILGTTALVAAAPNPTRATADHVYRVAAIGDSLTDTRVGGGRYLDALRKKCPESRFDAYGVGGQQTLHMRWRFQRDVLNKRYTDVIVLGGVNDLSARSPSYANTSQARKNLSYMYQSAHRKGLRVIALTVPPWGKLKFGDRRPEATRELNQWILEQRATGKVDVAVDIQPLLACGDPMNLCSAYRRYPTDAIHWSRTGHDVVAGALATEAFADCR